MFEADLGSFEDDDAEDFPEDMNEFIFGEDLEQDILSLGEEEKKMVKEDEGEDEDSPGLDGEEDQKPTAIGIDSGLGLNKIDNDSPGNLKKEDALGKSEEAAITLSSGESDSESVQHSAAPAATAGEPAAVAAAPAPSMVDTPLTNCRMYNMIFPGPSIGVDILQFQGRIMVDNIGTERQQRLGQNCKPAMGDVFVAVKNATKHILCPVGWGVPAFRQKMKELFTRPPVCITFAEVPEVREQFLRYRGQVQQTRQLAVPIAPPPAASSEVIEIDDSD